jgi:hypothetical protein
MRDAFGVRRDAIMTEQEWLACPVSLSMLDFLGEDVSIRKWRLLCCACCYRIWHFLEAPILREAVVALERFADDGIHKVAFRAIAEQTHPLLAYREEFLAENLSEKIALPAYGINRVVLGRSVSFENSTVGTLEPDSADLRKALEFFALAVGASADMDYDSLIPIASEKAAQSNLLRDIFGNPFRPVAFDPAWRTSSVTAVAWAIYDERRFTDMPILADALEEAGCTSADVLDHCRNGLEHVRGCHVLDLILGRE